MEEAPKAEQEAKPRRIQIPSDFTVGDLFAGVPVRLWGWIVTTLGATFTLGMTIGSIFHLDKETRGTIKTQAALDSPAQKQEAFVQKQEALSIPLPQPTAPSFELPDSIRRFQEKHAEEERMAKHFEPLVAAIRQRNKVGPIDRFQNDLPIARIPSGRFGYVIFSGVDSAIRGAIDLSLYETSSPLSFEIHKSIEGQVLLLFFVHEHDAYAFEDPQRRRKEFQIYNRPLNTNMKPVCLPIKSFSDFAPRILPDRDGVVAEIRLK